MTTMQPAAAPPAAAAPLAPGAPALAPAAPGSPAAAALQSSAVTGIPTTIQELQALKVRREELSNQLVSATSRRNSLAQRLRGTMEGADRVGLEQRIQFLDRRILQLESDIAVTGQQLTDAPAKLLATESRPPLGDRSAGRMQRGAIAIGSLLTLFVFAPMALAAARLMWRRATQPQSARDPETAQRLARLETAVDTIAIEVERVAEGQRFLTRILADPAHTSIGDASEADRVTQAVAIGDSPLPRY